MSQGGSVWLYLLSQFCHLQQCKLTGPVVTECGGWLDDTDSIKPSSRVLQGGVSLFQWKGQWRYVYFHGKPKQKSLNLWLLYRQYWKKNRGGRKRQQKTLWRGKIWLRLPKLSSLYRAGGVLKKNNPLLVGPFKLFAWNIKYKKP